MLLDVARSVATATAECEDWTSLGGGVRFLLQRVMSTSALNRSLLRNKGTCGGKTLPTQGFFDGVPEGVREAAYSKGKESFAKSEGVCEESRDASDSVLKLIGDETRWRTPTYQPTSPWPPQH